MKNLADEIAANRRLAILRLLAESRGVCNDSILQMALNRMGHAAGLTRDYVREQIRFLETAGLVTVEFFQDRVMVAKLTRRGGDVTAGTISCEGVAEPGFGD